MIFFSGSFPLSEVSLLSEEERDQYIPTIRTFIRVLDDSLANDGLDSKDINLLVNKCKEFSKLFPQSPHCNPLQGSTGKYRENPVMKTGTLQ